MKEKAYRRAMDCVEPGPEAAERLAEAVGRRKTRRRAAPVAAACVIAAALVLLPVLWPGKGAQVGQGGFSVTAYAAADGQMLAGDYAESLEPRAMEPGVILQLPRYSPLMSSVPGYPFLVRGSGTIRVTAQGGTLLRWAPPAGQVEDLGTAADCRDGDTIYWAPPGAEAFDQGAVLLFQAGGEQVRVVLTLGADGYSYTAELAE